MKITENLWTAICCLPILSAFRPGGLQILPAESRRLSQVTTDSAVYPYFIIFVARSDGNIGAVDGTAVVFIASSPAVSSSAQHHALAQSSFVSQPSWSVVFVRIVVFYFRRGQTRPRFSYVPQDWQHNVVKVTDITVYNYYSIICCICSITQSPLRTTHIASSSLMLFFFVKIIIYVVFSTCIVLYFIFSA